MWFLEKSIIKSGALRQFDRGYLMNELEIHSRTLNSGPIWQSLIPAVKQDIHHQMFLNYKALGQWQNALTYCLSLIEQFHFTAQFTEAVLADFYIQASLLSLKLRMFEVARFWAGAGAVRFESRPDLCFKFHLLEAECSINQQDHWNAYIQYLRAFSKQAIFATLSREDRKKFVEGLTRCIYASNTLYHWVNILKSMRDSLYKQHKNILADLYVDLARTSFGYPYFKPNDAAAWLNGGILVFDADPDLCLDFYLEKAQLIETYSGSFLNLKVYQDALNYLLQKGISTGAKVEKILEGLRGFNVMVPNNQPAQTTSVSQPDSTAVPLYFQNKPMTEADMLLGLYDVDRLEIEDPSQMIFCLK